MTTRPAEFDKRIREHVPFLRKMARLLCDDWDDQDDLVHEAVVDALHRWKSFKEEHGMAAWLGYVIRGKASIKKRKKSVPMHDGDHEEAMLTVRVDAPQGAAAELADTMALIGNMDEHTRDTLLSYAAGEEAESIGERYGVGKQAVTNRIKRARSDLASGIAMARRPYAVRKMAA